MVKGHLSRWLLLKVLEVKFLKILKVVGAYDSDRKQELQTNK
jgi:hypothetical protein